jgi:glycosyltransferase involved in cell wall biosynthesis
VPALLRRARALVVPSVWYEGAPRAIIEAYAAGVPVIASAIGALPELVRDGQSGLLADPGDTEAWRRAALTLSDPSTAERMGRLAYEVWRRRHSPERGLTALTAVYRTAIEARRRVVATPEPSA